MNIQIPDVYSAMSAADRLTTVTPLITTYTSATRILEIHLMMYRKPHFIAATTKAVLTFMHEEFGYETYCDYCHYTVTDPNWCFMNIGITPQWVSAYMNNNAIVSFEPIHVHTSWRYFKSSTGYGEDSE